MLACHASDRGFESRQLRLIMVNRKTKITAKKIAAISIPIFVILAIVLTFLFSDKDPQETVNIKSPAKKNKPSISSPYTGKSISNEVSIKRPMAVIIENSPRARPQTGLSKADWVFETVAEGGITRMMAFYHSQEADKLGPVRSVREYFASIAKSIDAVLIHAGGSPGGYEAVRELPVTNVDQIKEGKPFNRSRDRKAPHNLYSSTANLREYIQQKGYEGDPVDPGYTFTGGKPKSSEGVKEITVNYSSAPYKAVFSYEEASKTYKRVLAGKADIDTLTGKQIAVNNLAVMVADILLTNDEKGRVKVQTEGTGALYFFTGGKLIKGQWIRSGVNSPYKFINDKGEPINFSKGKTWFSIISSEQKVTYTVVTPPATPESQGTQPNPQESGI